MPTVIQRTILEEAPYVHDEPTTIEAAERIAGRRLDRRYNYAIIEGEVCTAVQWTQSCSGCTPGYEESGRFDNEGAGCDECGFTGKRRNGHWVPLERKAA